MNSLSEYIDWHYFEMWPKLTQMWHNAIIFPVYYFSVPRHIETLFDPWKRQRTKMGPGFDFGQFFSVMSFNLMSRIIGAIMRLTMIFYALAFSLLMAIGGLLMIIIWVIIPGLTYPWFLTRTIPLEKKLQHIIDESSGNLQMITIRIFSLDSGQFVIKRLGFDPQAFLQLLSSTPTLEYFPQFQQQLVEKQISLISVITALAATYPPLIAILEQYNRTADTLIQATVWYEEWEQRKEKPLLADTQRIRTIAGIGADWSFGYTPQFDKFARDVTKEPTPYKLLIGRDAEIDKIEQMMSKTQNNNVLLVGEPGTDRHIIIDTLAYRVVMGHCLPSLAHKRILHLDMHAIISAKPSIGEIKGLLSEILDEAEYAGNIIVFVDDIDRYVSSTDGRYDLSDVFEKFAISQVSFIGITTSGGYNRYIEPNANLAQLFDRLEILPPALEIVMQQLKHSIVPALEAKHHLIISFPALIKAVSDADRYISATALPGKAIDLLDQTCVYVSTIKHELILQPEHIDEFLSQKFHTAIGDLQKNEKEKLAHLEDLMHKRVINQETAIHAIASSLRRARLNISATTRPIGSFLFLGPTGVGKTETAKALSEVYFGAEDAMLRFDMSEFQSEEGLERLIGSSSTGSPGELTAKLTSHPFSLILLDEIEKADKKIFNLFLSLIDEGYINDASGKKIDARNTIIIATSNAGAEHIREQVHAGVTGDTLNKNILDFIQTKNLFSPEFLNRFDGVIVFTPLSEGHMREVARLMLNSLNKRLLPREISVAITPELINALAVRGMQEEEFGGRAMRRIISETIEDQVAQKVLAGTIKKGEVITITL